MRSSAKAAWTAGCTVALALGAAGPAATAAAPQGESNLLASVLRQGLLRVTVVSGRMISGSRGFAHTSTATVGGRKEQFSIGGSAANPVVSFQSDAPDSLLKIEFSGTSRLEISRTPKAGSSVVPIEFHQAPGEPVLLKVGAPGKDRVYRGQSLWHLALAEPAAFRDHLAPWLKMLQHDWDPQQVASEVEQALVRLASEREQPNRQQWAQWVRQLGDPEFSVREKADRQLRQAGRSAAGYLERLDAGQLDAEQRYRIRRIVQSFSGAGQDSSEQIAAWMSGEPAVWLALLARDAEPTRRAALGQLEAILGARVAFDPAAAASVRAKQIEELRAQILSK